MPQTCRTQNDRSVPNSKYSKVRASLLVIPWVVQGELLNAGPAINHHPLTIRHVEVIPRSGQVNTSLLSAFYCQLPSSHGYGAPTNPPNVSIKRLNCQLGNERLPGLVFVNSKASPNRIAHVASRRSVTYDGSGKLRTDSHHSKRCSTHRDTK